MRVFLTVLVLAIAVGALISVTVLPRELAHRGATDWTKDKGWPFWSRVVFLAVLELLIFSAIPWIWDVTP